MASKKRAPRATRTMYLHTLDGKPARFEEWWEGGAACAMVVWIEDGAYSAGPRSRVTLCTSLDQIRREQARSSAYRTTRGFPAQRYGYVRVEVPDDPR